MALDIKFNVYYSTSREGPWILANTTPIDHIPEGNQYTVTGLKIDVTYYFLIVGGYIEDGVLVPLVSQHIGPDGAAAAAFGTITKPIAFSKPFAPHIEAETSLGHRFNIPGIYKTDGLGHRFAVTWKYTETFEGSATWVENEWWSAPVDPRVALTFTNVTFTGPKTLEDFEVW